ncbi:hypothetical protein ACIBK9_47155 [Nonomuraea sp. NPDC050227]|uniref:hypothetical protein n=1 Tax=Nonomuraea sp. NPDC050227 TaxID=3364360 RepID=UPI003794FE7F
MAVVVNIVSVRDGQLVSRATLADDGTVTYQGDAARSAVRRWLLANRGRTEADAIRALAVDGWSNGYLMVQRDQ